MFSLWEIIRNVVPSMYCVFTILCIQARDKPRPISYTCLYIMHACTQPIPYTCNIAMCCKYPFCSIEIEMIYCYAIFLVHISFKLLHMIV